MIQRQVFSICRTLPGHGRLRMNSSVSGLRIRPDRQFLGGAGEEVAGEGRDIFAAVGQPRNVDADHVQAVEQVLAELAGLHQRLQVLVSGGDDAHIDLDRYVAAHAIELAIGQHSQQAGLCVGGHVADLVEEQGAAVGLLEAPSAQVGGAGEGALSWPNSSTPSGPWGWLPCSGR